MAAQNIGVVGAGVMGSGIAQALAQTGHDVLLVDNSAAVLDNVKNEIRNGLRLQKLTGNAPAEPRLNIAEILGRIKTTIEYETLATADFVIETITENWTAKEELYRRLDRCCTARCIFASNTSAISITRIGSVTERPPQVVGIHFMNPVPLRLTVEVIRGFHTSEDTLNIAKQLLARMGKECVLVNDMPGFVSNRVLMLTINEAIFLVQDRVAEVEDIDRVFRECLGHAMGPLATADLIGLDTILYSLEVLQESYADDKYRPCPLLKKMVHAGLLGRKSSRGFYDYDTI